MSELYLKCIAHEDDSLTVYSAICKEYLAMTIKEEGDESSCFINKDQAKQLIEHLNKEFGL